MSQSGAPTRLVKVFAGRPLKRHGKGDVLRLEFRGDPCFSVYDPKQELGGLCSIKRRDLEKSFAAWVNGLKSEFGGDGKSLQIKVIAWKSDETQVKSLLAKAGLSPQAVATFNDGEALECFFFADSGRLRVAPLESAAVAPAKASVSRVSAPGASRAEAAEEGPSDPFQGRKARVLIVDDSKTMRQLLRKIIEASSNLEVAGEAERPSEARKLIEQVKPDVMTLDINMPEMTGVEFLRQILPQRFIPTVMISSIGINEGHEVLSAFELGAVDYIQKPAANEMAAMLPIINEKIFAAANVRRTSEKRKKAQADGMVKRLGQRFESSKLIAVGASTGGTEAIKSVFTQFPENVPPIVVVQHIPPYFSTAFANRLNDLCRFEVREAKDGDELRPGLALIAPGGLHMEIQRKGSQLVARVFDAEAVNRFKPSVDVLFRSVARELGGKATGVLMTGMGSDGAKGLLEMKKAGAHTIAQDKESCVVFGMPRAAIEIGAATEIKSLDDIPDALMKAA